MVTTVRTQKRSDQRLRDLVRTTQDVSYAVQCGVPRSTARGWLSASTVEVVTLDSLNMDASELQREVLHLQTRISKLIALLRVLLVVLKIPRFSLNQTRFPDGKDKHSLLRVVDQSRSALPLRSVLRVLRLSPSRYHHWKQEDPCALDDRPSCPRVSAHQLTAAEVETIHDLATSQEYRHVPTGTLAILAQRSRQHSTQRPPPRFCSPPQRESTTARQPCWPTGALRTTTELSTNSSVPGCFIAFWPARRSRIPIR